MNDHRDVCTCVVAEAPDQKDVLLIHKVFDELVGVKGIAYEFPDAQRLIERIAILFINNLEQIIYNIYLIGTLH